MQNKLDPWHLIQRPFQHISEKNPHKKQAISELKSNVLHFNNQGTNITQTTDSPDIMLANFCAWQNRWEPKFPQQFQSNCNNLQKHIQKGCCSDIPPGAATSQNECFHSHYNKSNDSITHVSPQTAQIRIVSLIIANYKLDSRKCDKQPLTFTRFIVQLLTNQLLNENELPNKDLPPIFSKNIEYINYNPIKPSILCDINNNIFNQLENILLQSFNKIEQFKYIQNKSICM